MNNQIFPLKAKSDKRSGIASLVLEMASIRLAVDNPAVLEFPDPVTFSSLFLPPLWSVRAYNGITFDTSQIITSRSMIIHCVFPKI